MVRVAPAPLIVRLRHTAAALITGMLGALVGITTSVVLVGITPQDQLEVVFQSVLLVPSQVPFGVIVKVVGELETVPFVAVTETAPVVPLPTVTVTDVAVLPVIVAAVPRL